VKSIILNILRLLVGGQIGYMVSCQLDIVSVIKINFVFK
jgi:hypothetical protein